MADDTRLHLLNNGRAPKNKSGDLVTRKDVEQFVESFANNVLLPKVNEMLQHYMMQVPELVARMMADAMKANGLELLPPNWKRVEAESPASDTAPSDAEGSE